MRSFRLYHLDDGQIARAEIVEAADEAGAIEEAVARSKRGRTELWDGTRLVLAYAGSAPGPEGG